ncbi:uncharacterized protein LOC117187844 [Drosophila miranda]|uniref:uncharacterized protein LOC117187844 n=1 Tax=Drosophila miranda TaxID=7229 RepID=UPI0007E7E917|nr:uncharacterized protein LOC117187844 [Drosophila miranda]
MKFVGFLLLSSLTIVMVVAFPGDHSAHPDLPDAGDHANAISRSAAPATTADQVDSLVREPRHLLKYLLSKPVVVQPIVYQPVAVPRHGYPSYGYSNPYYGIRQY